MIYDKKPTSPYTASYTNSKSRSSALSTFCECLLEAKRTHRRISFQLGGPGTDP